MLFYPIQQTKDRKCVHAVINLVNYLALRVYVIVMLITTWERNSQLDFVLNPETVLLCKLSCYAVLYFA